MLFIICSRNICSRRDKQGFASLFPSWYGAFAGETDDTWLQDLQTVLQDLPGSLFPEAARKSSPDFHLSDGSYQILERSNDDDILVPAKSIVENLDSIGVLKIVIFSITFWQRVLSSSQARVPDSTGKLAREKVEALAR